MNTHDPIVIVSAARTPIGSFQGALAPLTTPELGGMAIRAAIERADIDAAIIDECIMGCVLSAGLGQAPARQAAHYAHIPRHVGATTINKMCGSGLKAIMQACTSLMAGTSKVHIAGGMESMSNAPYLLNKARQGFRLGHQQCLDHMYLDGLEDAYEPGKLMGVFAEETAAHYQLSRQQQDAYAARSQERALHAIQAGLFDQEITPVVAKLQKDTLTITTDEGPSQDKLAKISKLKPAFMPDGTVTAANASSISDGASAVCLMPLSVAKHYGLPPLAEIVAMQSHAQEPNWFTTAPIQAIEKTLAAAKWSVEDVDLFEINEAFALVTLAAIESLKLNPDKVNVHGGACALGHPIGASGARILVTLLYALTHYDLNQGIASLCIGGGEAVSMAIRRL